MLFYCKNPGFVTKIPYYPVRLGKRYETQSFRETKKVFKISYSKGPEHSYAREIIERYPLTNE